MDLAKLIRAPGFVRQFYDFNGRNAITETSLEELRV
jgi:hypothetical protein